MRKRVQCRRGRASPAIRLEKGYREMEIEMGRAGDMSYVAK